MENNQLQKYYKNLAALVVHTGKRIKKNLDYRKIIGAKANDDLVTRADMLVEKHVTGFIKKHFPTHGFNSEEAGRYQAGADYIWILDPLDGTKYYSKGISLYSISLGLEYKKELILGIVYIPETQQLFSAYRGSGRGALLNKHPIRCGTEKPLEEVDICLEIPNKNAPPEKIQAALEKMKTLVTHTKRVRIIGVGSIGLCYCAMAGFDLYLNLGSQYKYCDYAAGKVIIEQAGGEFTILKNGMIAGNRELVQKIIRLLHLE